MTNLLNYTLPELTDWMQTELGEPKFRAVQVWQWIWQKMARDFEAMSNVSKACRARLAETARIGWPEVARVQESSDGTTKFLLRLEDGALVETVLIPSDSREGVRRWTQCLSSQVGCAMGCTFCATGGMGFERNMTMGEILGQILVAREHLGDNRPDWPVLRNLVFMGMGEPLLNLREVMRALQSLNNDKGLNFSPRRITVSTCGIEKGLAELGASGLAYLALGHIHKGAEPLTFGGTVCAWPGCPEGRGFDELGEKGFYSGTIDDSGKVSLTFVPFARRRYEILTVDVTEQDHRADIEAALPADTAQDLYRILLTGEAGEGGVHTDALKAALADRFYALELRDRTRLAEDLWAKAEEDSLRGLFLRDLKQQLAQAQTEEDRQRVTMAARFGLAALDHRDLG